LVSILSLSACDNEKAAKAADGKTVITAEGKSGRQEQTAMESKGCSVMRDDLLGTVITLTAYDGTTESTLNAAFSVIEDIDRRMSAGGPNSEVYKLNEQGGGTVSADIYALIDRAVAVSNWSGGAFDIAIGGITSLWKTDGTFGKLPEQEAIRAALPTANYRHLVLENANRIRFARQGLKIDLGAIAKGYACDQIRKYLIEKAGVRTALLDLGGNIHAIGKKPDGTEWKIGIASPLPEDEAIACAVSLSNQSVVTSGGYQRYFEQDGVFYHHILDPRTGYPTDNELLSATVISPVSATEADALSTACFVLGLKKGQALLESKEGYEGLFITKDKQVYITEGLKGKVEIIDQRFVFGS
jgi:thiamine biosynthesis lipoprotein